MGSAVSKNQSISEWLGQYSTNTKKAKFMDRFIFLFLLLINEIEKVIKSISKSCIARTISKYKETGTVISNNL